MCAERVQLVVSLSLEGERIRVIVGVNERTPSHCIDPIVQNKAAVIAFILN